jgi:DNA-directed RNA polymerase specialized sigma24 family protein
LTVEGRPLEDEVRHDERRSDERPDAELIDRARKGDLMAYEELVRRHQAVAIRTAHLFAPDGDAEDAVQEAFVGSVRCLLETAP